MTVAELIEQLMDNCAMGDMVRIIYDGADYLLVTQHEGIIEYDYILAVNGD